MHPENTSPHKDVYINFYRGFIDNSQELETTLKSSTGKCINKMCYLYNGILLINKKEWTTDIPHGLISMHYAKRKKTDVKEYILHDSTYL